MSVQEHKEGAPKKVNCKVITVSDTRSKETGKGVTLSFSQLSDFITELSERLGQKDAKLEVSFPWVYEQPSPASFLTGLNYADVRILLSYQHGKIERTVELICAVTTLPLFEGN